jgi:hypothetical protein
MPNMANYIFTKCISGKKNIHKKTYNYEFLEDIYYMPDGRNIIMRYKKKKENSLGTSPYICQKIDNGKLRPEAKQRNENFDSIVQTHPLTLMVWIINIGKTVKIFVFFCILSYGLSNECMKNF